MRQINRIILHCSASKDGVPVTYADLLRIHLARGFRKIGYHYIIEPDGTMFTGRPEREIGAHCEGHNADSIGICMLGTLRFSEDAWKAQAQLVTALLRRYPSAEVVGHRDMSPDLDKDGKIEPNEWLKLCPNYDVRSWVASKFTPAKENIL